MDGSSPSRFETALKQLATKSAGFREKTASSQEKEGMLLEFAGLGRHVTD